MPTTLIEILKSLFLGIVEGITEWLPISSTGHMLLVDEFLTLGGSEAFKETFFVVIQLGAIAAVVVLFFERMMPIRLDRAPGPRIKKDTLLLWCRIALACLPGALAALLLDDLVERHLHTPVVIAAALVLYGIAFLLIERARKGKTPRVEHLEQIGWRDALLIGIFQVLAIIPGTSRSGATILGALLIGISRTAAAEFTFFLAVPTMLGMSLLKLLSFGLGFSSTEAIVLLSGTLTAFVVSLLAIRFLLSYVRRHDFKLFGIYRIVLGLIVLALLL